MTAQVLLSTTKTFKPATVTLEQYFRFLNGDLNEQLALSVGSTEAMMRYIAAEWNITEEEARAAYAYTGWV